MTDYSKGFQDRLKAELEEGRKRNAFWAGENKKNAAAARKAGETVEAEDEVTEAPPTVAPAGVQNKLTQREIESVNAELAPKPFAVPRVDGPDDEATAAKLMEDKGREEPYVSTFRDDGDAEDVKVSKAEQKERQEDAKKAEASAQKYEAGTREVDEEKPEEVRRTDAGDEAEARVKDKVDAKLMRRPGRPRKVAVDEKPEEYGEPEERERMLPHEDGK